MGENWLLCYRNVSETLVTHFLRLVHHWHAAMGFCFICFYQPFLFRVIMYICSCNGAAYPGFFFFFSKVTRKLWRWDVGGSWMWAKHLFLVCSFPALWGWHVSWFEKEKKITHFPQPGSTWSCNCDGARPLSFFASLELETCFFPA